MLGTTIHSHYKIVKFLGVGRAGSTYLAEDLDLPNLRPCVIKKFYDNQPNLVASPLIEKLFNIQTAILHKVGQHPQIPTLIAKFEENGQRYLVQEYINGESLDRELSPGMMWSQKQVCDFLMDLMAILSFVHSFKYIHQDINPHNIVRRNSDGRFCLLGFSGIKALDNGWKNPPAEVVRLASSIGTHGYIPYEQEQNFAQLNSDIYAVGVIAIQALTGRFPIDRDPETYQLKWRDGLKINLRLLDIIDRMVRPDYRNRYQSVLEVLGDLQSFAQTQIPPSKFDRLKPHLIFGSAACTLLLAVGTVKLMSASADKPKAIATNSSLSQQEALPKKTASNNKMDWQTYQDPTNGVKIKYYPTWQPQEIHNLVTGENSIFISPQQSRIDKYRENVSIRIENLTNLQTTLPDYSKSAIAEIRKYYKDAKIIESSSIILANKPASLIVYTGKDENSMPIQNLEIWTINGGKVYILTYKAEPQQYYAFLQTVMTMINSFQIVSSH